MKPILSPAALAGKKDKWIPKAKILHPYPEERFYAIHPR